MPHHIPVRRLFLSATAIFIAIVDGFPTVHIQVSPPSLQNAHGLRGWVESSEGEWEWVDDNPNHMAPKIATKSEATPTLPSGAFKPKQSLGQNFLRDGNTVTKILKAFHKDATRYREAVVNIVELGPGAGALTDPLVKMYGTNVLQCIEIDQRSVELLAEKHPNLLVHHQDVLQVDYPNMAKEIGQPLVVFGNLPYYITSQILFALADACHSGAVDCATVTMQWEVAQRMVASIKTKDYGILSVVFQLYGKAISCVKQLFAANSDRFIFVADTNCHFKIPPTVFYPQPKVDSALVGLHFLTPAALRERLAGVDPANLRKVVTTSFGQRRKTLRNTLKKLALQVCGDDEDKAKALLDSPPLPLPEITAASRERGDAFSATQELPTDWASKRPEEITPGQFVELTRLLYGPVDGVADYSKPLGTKVWRKLKHGVA